MKSVKTIWLFNVFEMNFYRGSFLENAFKINLDRLFFLFIFKN